MFHVEQRPEWWNYLISGCSQFHISINEEVLAQLSVYLRELRAWNRKMNLSGFDSPMEVASKHFLDSLAGANILRDETTASVLDIGSGAGFPGLPLKILYPSLSLRMLEPSSKKTAFLRHMIGILELKDVSVVSRRVEDLAKEDAEQSQYDYALTRAVKPEQILKTVPYLLSARGKLILWRTAPLKVEDLSGFKQEGEFVYSLNKETWERRIIILINH